MDSPVRIKISTTLILAGSRFTGIGKNADTLRRSRRVAVGWGERARSPDIRGCGCADTRATVSVHPTRRRTAMTQNSEQHYQKATVIGGGVIGASWTALFLARGLDVTVCDPAPGIAQRIRTELAAITPNLEQLGLPDVSSSSMPLHFDPEITTAVAGSDIVQENGPERLEIKQQLWQAVESAAPAHAILASSSSSIPASAMASGMKDPGRLIIGHPFNPPHLVPLVEIVASSSTPADVVDRAVGFYRAMGKRPQVLAKEIPGFVANRLQAALFREAVYL